MNIFKLYKNSFTTAVQNPTVTLFLVLFLIVSNLIASYMFFAHTKVVAIILSFCLFMLSLCFVSGWFNIVKEVTKDEKSKKEAHNSSELLDATRLEASTSSKQYFGIFLEGIGKNIIPVGIGSFIYTLILFLVFVLASFVASKVFGSIDFLFKDLVAIAQDNNALMEYFEKLNVDQKYIIIGWQLSYITFSMVYNFIMLFYYPALIFDEKSYIFLKPFVALKNSICFLFKNFFPSLFIYVCIYSTYVFLGVIKAIFATNPIISILILFFYIYFISGAVVLIFSYYGQKANSDNGCDCIRENQDIDKSSENN